MGALSLAKSLCLNSRHRMSWFSQSWYSNLHYFYISVCNLTKMASNRRVWSYVYIYIYIYMRVYNVQARSQYLWQYLWLILASRDPWIDVSIKYRSDTFTSDRYLIDVSPKVFEIWDITACLWRWSGIGHVHSLQWRHNGRDSVSNHQPHDCLLNRLFWRRSKKTSKLRVTGLCVGNSPGTHICRRMVSLGHNELWD